MSYEPTNWKSGDVVTSAKLNKLEQGVAAAGGGGVLVVNTTYDESTETTTCDKTGQQILSAFEAGTVVLFKYEFGPPGVERADLCISAGSALPSGYFFSHIGQGSTAQSDFICTELSEYPYYVG